ncbi:Uracil DNA glycosylase superfamily protein [Pricia antarctica]|uniref:Uracil DNA glycosylase superfamily protein n=1 Tax=Pricia antarctica TaxID=641691 RepID=A0A1G7IEQ9_9FLAO|nr:hypothetical protein [Pricia antarctica]SDF11240.1 Uracil DNA glycosylase superfamily protein [Pricia antarctica]
MNKELLAAIPQKLWDVNGAVFYSGSKAFEGKKPVYLLGINPGGKLEDNLDQTIKSHTVKIGGKEFWSEYADEVWTSKNAGESPHQRRVVHLLNSLGLEPQLTPASNMIFQRSRLERDIAEDFNDLAGLCWPFHEKVIDALEVKNIICFGKRVGGFVRSKLNASDLIDTFTENNKRKWQTNIYKNTQGLTVILTTHPSRVNWLNPNSDPTPLIKRHLIH